MKLPIILFVLLFFVYVSATCGARKKRSARSVSFNRNINRPVKSRGVLERSDSDEDGTDCINDGEDGGFTDSLKNAMKNLQKRMRQMFGNEEDEEEDVNIDIQIDDEDSDSESFYERVIGRFQPWWKGKNVCKREEEKRLPPGDTETSSFFSIISSSCMDTGRSYKCSMKTTKNNTNIVRTLIYECCYGFARKNDERGCTKKIDIKPMIPTLQKLNLTRLLHFLDSTGLLTMVETESNLTIFAPTDDAIDNPEHDDEISVVVLKTDDKMHFARDILSSHIVKRRIGLDDMEDEHVYETMKPGISIRANFFSHHKPLVTVNCAKIISFDNPATNGIVHVVDRVLPQATLTLIQMLEQDPRFSSFLSMMDERTRNVLSLEQDNHYTVFAFTNDVYNGLPQKTKNRFTTKHSCLSNIINKHIVPHTICSEAIQNRAQTFTISGVPLLLSRTGQDGSFMVNDKKVTVYDRVAVNGVMHIIDGLLTNTQNDDVIDALDKIGYGSVKAALIETGLSGGVEQLKTVGLFLPPKRVLANMSSFSWDEKRLMLQNHIVERSQFAPHRRDINVQTSAGNTYHIAVTYPESFSLSFGHPKRTIGCAKFINPPVTTCNGVIHFIDRILPIPRQNLMELLRSRSDLSVFTTLIEAAGIDNKLASHEEDSFTYTVFAPNNAAIERHLKPDIQRNLLNDMEKLKNFVNRHIVADRVCCHELESESWFDETTIVTEARTYVQSHGSEDEEVFIGGATVKQCNVEGTNGLLHVIDRPFPPPRRFFGLMSGRD